MLFDACLYGELDETCGVIKDGIGKLGGLLIVFTIPLIVAVAPAVNGEVEVNDVEVSVFVLPPERSCEVDGARVANVLLLEILLLLSVNGMATTRGS